MWQKLLIVLASACPINPLFPIPPEYIGPKTRATLTCIIDWHIKNNLDEFSALAKSVWGIYTPFNNLEEFINEFNKVQIIEDETQQSYKLDFMPAVNLSGLRSIFKPKKFKCKANNSKFGKIKIAYDLKLPANMDFTKVQNILHGCIYNIPPNLYQGIIESQTPKQVYNELSVITITLIVLLSIALSVIHTSVMNKRTPAFGLYTEFESILHILVPFILVSLYERSIYVVLVAQLFILILYFRRNRNLFNWPLTDKDLYSRQSISNTGTFEFVTLFRVAFLVPVYISITAVDFITFSPIFFKSTHEGMTIMDIASGIFIISAAMVSPISNRFKNDVKDFKTMFKMALKKACILFLIGLIRLGVTKFFDYRVPVREYGVFGNFFFVLGFVTLVAETLIYLSTPKWCFGIALFYSIVYDSLIYKYELEKLLNKNPRNTFPLMNLECLLNIAGSIPLYMFAHILRHYLMLLDERQKESANNNVETTPQQPKNEKSKFMKLFSKPPGTSPDAKVEEEPVNYGNAKAMTLFNIGWITMLFYYALGYAGLNAVRVMSNLRYNLFIFSVTAFTLLLSILFTIYFDLYKPNETILMLNKNPLATFVYSNVFTGLINMAIQTKLMPMYITAAILFIYSLSFIVFAYVFNRWRAGNLKFVIPEFKYETINYQHIELSQLNSNNINPVVNSTPVSSSRDGRMNMLREKLDILRTKVGRMSNTDIAQKEQ